MFPRNVSSVQVRVRTLKRNVSTHFSTYEDMYMCNI